MAFPETLYLVIEALDESAQRRWRVAVEVRYTCLVGLRRSLARHLEGLYPFHLSQVSCSKLMAFPEVLYLVIEALDESAQRRWRVAVEVRYTCLVGLRRSLARHLEGLYPFHLSQVSCSKLMAFPEALYLVIEALDESAQRRWRIAVEVRYTCLVGLRRSLARPKFHPDFGHKSVTSQ